VLYIDDTRKTVQVKHTVCYLHLIVLIESYFCSKLTFSNRVFRFVSIYPRKWNFRCNAILNSKSNIHAIPYVQAALFAANYSSSMAAHIFTTLFLSYSDYLSVKNIFIARKKLRLLQKYKNSTTRRNLTYLNARASTYVCYKLISCFSFRLS